MTVPAIRRVLAYFPERSTAAVTLYLDNLRRRVEAIAPTPVECSALLGEIALVHRQARRARRLSAMIERTANPVRAFGCRRSSILSSWHPE